MLNILFAPVQTVLNLKQHTIAALNRLEISIIRDLVFYKPNSYHKKNLSPNLSQLQQGEIIQAQVIIDEIIFPTSKKQPMRIIVSNDTGSILLIFFHKIPDFIFNKLKVGSNHFITGKVQIFDNYYQISHPEFIKQPSMFSSLEPIYPLTHGLLNRQLYSYIVQALVMLDKALRSREHNYGAEKFDYLVELLDNLKIIHLYKLNIPLSEVKQNWQRAITILAQKELTANQLSLIKLRYQKNCRQGRIFKNTYHLQQTILQKLGFELTAAQQKVMQEIERDQNEPIQMMRLLQGDVGSGKTLVALLTMVNAQGSGAQSVLMAPTDLLAQQHYQFFIQALDGSDIKSDILTGKTSAKDRKRIIYELENGDIDILIGTHALFQDKVNFRNLGYIVIDEQHRFGVEQRLALFNKATCPDVLIMTATPIPRSLTLTMFGDMDISKLDGKPKDRLPIITKMISNKNIDELISKLSAKLASGEKSYWICPLIDVQEQESMGIGEEYRLMDVNTRFLALNAIYPNKFGVLHGKMSAEQKELVMRQFKNGEFQLIVATTVIEVGIDVPEATLIIIENAERFGLAQLHQLRGRVGRGNKQSYCLLIYSDNQLSAMARKRLRIMTQHNDGFYIAEQDLMLRGSGELIGTKQSGEPRFFFANLSGHLDILMQAHKNAEEFNKNIDNSFIDLQIRLFAKSNNALQ